MRKAWFKNLQLLVLIFLFLFVFSFSFSFKSLSAEAGESASLQFGLTLAPAEAVVPGDRITRQILLENLTDKQLKYSVEEIRCTGTAALLPYLTLQLSAGEETLFSARADQLGVMSSFPISIPVSPVKGDVEGVVRDGATGEVRMAEAVLSAEKADGAAALMLILDFSPAAEASLMGSKAQVELLLSAEEVTAGESKVPESVAPETVPPETEVPETRPAETKVPASGTEALETKPTETKVPETMETDKEALTPTEKETTATSAGASEMERTDSGTTETVGNARQEEGATEQRKESVAEGSAGKTSSGGKSSRGVLFGGAISFWGGPGTAQILEVPEDPPTTDGSAQTAENQNRESAAQKTEKNTMDSRLMALLDRLRKKQRNSGEVPEESLSAEGKVLASARGDLSVWVEESGVQGLRIQKAQSIYGGEAVTIYLGEENMKGSVRRIFGALGNLLLWLLILIALYFAFSAYQERRTGKPFFFMGYKPVLILSESMEPTYPKGAIVLVRKQKRAAEPGDVVMFSPEEGSGTYVIHRIVAESGEGFITRGDHNNTEDPGAIAPEQIYGTVKGLLWC